MTAKEFLSQAFKLDQKIKIKQDQIKRLSDMQYNISNTLSFDRVQTSHQPDRMADLTAAVMDLVSDYAKDVTRLLRLKYDIKKAIDRVERDDYRILLTLRYVDLLKWDDIAEAMNYHVTYIYRLHGKALLSIEVYVANVI